MDGIFLIGYGKGSDNATCEFESKYFDKRVRKLWQSCLKGAGLNWSNIDRAKREPKARGKWRNLKGSDFDPHEKSSLCCWDDDDNDSDDNNNNDKRTLPGGHIPLWELALVKDDKIQMKYNFGDKYTFTITLLEEHELQTAHKEVKI